MRPQRLELRRSGGEYGKQDRCTGETFEEFVRFVRERNTENKPIKNTDFYRKEFIDVPIEGAEVYKKGFSELLTSDVTGRMNFNVGRVVSHGETRIMGKVIINEKVM